MRLIDADALLEKVWDADTRVGYVQVVDRGDIEEAPTIEERKSGKWIIKNTNSRVTTYKCSECGRIVRDDTGYDVSKDYPYCHCGADLRGKQK